MSFVPEQLRKAAKIYEERSALYGDNYKKFGTWTQPLLRNIILQTPDDFNRFGVLLQMLSKISRYVVQFNKGGHKDSLDDLAVYSMMLQELDFAGKKAGEKKLADYDFFKNYQQRLGDAGNL